MVKLQLKAYDDEAMLVTAQVEVDQIVYIDGLTYVVDAIEKDRGSVTIKYRRHPD